MRKEIGSASFMQRGSCLGSDPGLFFPSQGETAKEEKAKAICDGCEVELECLEYALINRSPGVCGGTSANERKGILRQRKAAATV